MIKSLKEMGVTLADIKKYMKNRSPESCTMLLKAHEEKLKQEIKKINTTIKLIEEKQNAIQAYFKSTAECVQIVFEQKEVLFITKSTSDNYYETFAKHIKNAKQTALNLPCAVGHIIENKDFANKTYFDYYFSKAKIAGASTLIKPKGNYLNYYHKNGYFTIDEAYEAILLYAQENNIELGEYFFEYMVLDELSVNGIENYVIKISIAVL